MHCTRRDLLRLTALTATATGFGRHMALAQAAVGQAPAAPAAATPAPLVTAFTKLRRNIGIFTGQGGTIGFLINPAGIVIVDTQYPVTAKVCLEGIETRAPKRRIDVVLNTHHHGDHTGGNGVFRASAKKIVAHANVPGYQKDAAAVQPPNPNAPPTPTFPDTTFPERWRVEIGDEVVSAWHEGPAHTGGDVMVLFEEANVTHMGDLTFNRMQPFIDRARGGSIANWMTLLEGVMKEDPADRLYIFGHANPKFQVTGSKADLAVQRDYFTALLEYTRAKVKAGTPREVFITSKDVLKGFDDHGPLFDRALAAAFDEVSAEK